jgi:EpsI family protein
VLSAKISAILLFLAWIYSFWPTLVSIYVTNTVQLGNPKVILVIAVVITLAVARWYKLARVTPYYSRYGIVILFCIVAFWGLKFVDGQEFWQQLSVILMIPVLMLISGSIATTNLHWLKPTIISCCIMFIIPWFADNIKNNPWSNKKTNILFYAPQDLPEWSGPFELSKAIWQPSFIGATQTVTASYTNNMEYVYLYAAYFTSCLDGNAVSSASNKLYADKIWQSVAVTSLNVNITTTVNINVKEEIIQAGELKQIIWSWYYMGTVMSANDSLMQLLESASLVSKMADHSGVVALMTKSEPNQDLARERLTKFLISLYPQIQLLMNPIETSA